MAVFSSGSAAALNGKVTQVFDGESLTILSQTHTLKVKLIGVAAPEKSQSYAEVARQHLTDLTLNKFVVVRYSALRDGYLVGQVMLGDMDISAQMLRDGVGWYKLYDGDISEPDRQMYQASQAAARSERRGLWQDESPLAPWDFRKEQQAQQSKSHVGLESLSRPTASLSKTRRPGLSSEDLMSGVIPTGSFAGKPDVRQISTNGAQGRWVRYQPADKHFAILAPSDGVEVSYKVLAPEGQVRDVHYLVGVDISRKTIYFITWNKGTNGVSTDTSTVEDAVNGFLSEVNRVRAHYGEVLVTATPGRTIKLAGYEGREFALATGSTSGSIRVLSKQTGSDREVFLFGVLTPPGAPTPDHGFFNSFTIRQN